MSLVGALLFCNDCGGLLERCPASQANIDCDVCGKRNKNKWPTSITTESAATAFPSRLRDARSEIQVLSAEDRETWAMTTTACPQCANPEMRFRDVQLRGADEGSTIFYRCPKCDYKPRPSKLCSGCKNIRYYSRAHQKLDWPVHSTVCKQFRQLEARPVPDMPNKCIEHLTNGEISDWNGPVLAFSRHYFPSEAIKGTATAPRTLRDMDTTTLNFIMKKIRRLVPPNSFNVIHGVRVSCDGHIKKYNTPQFKPEMIKRFMIPGLSNKISEPHLTRLVLGDGLLVHGLYTEKGLDNRNPMASLLGIRCANDGAAWGYYKRQKWGNCFVMRADGKPLTVDYLKTLCRWIDKDLRKLFNATRRVESRERENPAYSPEEFLKARGDVTNKISLQRLLEFSKGSLEEDTVDEEVPEPEDDDEEMKKEDDENEDGHI
ncbi:hypothetical protein E4T49_01676 [Aureobasidium sp. EXF-10728]|nr:hypothetical protein E4T49_01676 [Aureobasidium sp. EXF-10728]